ncbi:MAG: glutathione synthase [Halothiobacillaceae bacterium]|nr:glutathione synthase [Halothiobacillaceae bacterium]
MSGTIRLGVVMDPIAAIKVHKDSSFAMLLAAQGRGWTLRYIEPDALWARDGEAWARMTPIEVRDDPEDWFTLGEAQDAPLSVLDIVLMRKDPPFDANFLYLTQILQLAQKQGVLVANRPESLATANEKLFAQHFPELCPPTLVTRERARLRAFLAEQGEIVVKPLDAMGGASVFRIQSNDPNLNVILETMTALDTRLVMAQRFLPAVSEGDRRILLIDGEPIEYALARIPREGEFRANLAVGGRGVASLLTAREREICAQVGPVLRDMGLHFVGLDVIGGYLTEINVTSPTCIRELDAAHGLDIAGRLLDALLAHRRKMSR